MYKSKKQINLNLPEPLQDEILKVASAGLWTRVVNEIVYSSGLVIPQSIKFLVRGLSV